MLDPFVAEPCPLPLKNWERVFPYKQSASTTRSAVQNCSLVEFMRSVIILKELDWRSSILLFRSNSGL